MNNGKIIWWVILGVMIVVIVWQFYWTDESENKCCTLSSELSDANIPDTDSASTFCKRNGKYYKSYTMGITGKLVEDEISEQQFNSAWQNGKCVKG